MSLWSYIALCWPAEALERGDDLLGLRQGLLNEGWRLAVDDPTLWVFLNGQSIPRVRRIDRDSGVVIGDLFAVRGGPAPEVIVFDQDPKSAAIAGRLCRDFWGRYVGVILSPDGQAVWRDPSGAVEAFAWSRGATTVIASAFPNVLLKVLCSSLSIDWGELAGYLANPSDMTGYSAFRGVHGVSPGALAIIRSGGVQENQLWRPSRFVAAKGLTFDEGAGLLRSAVDQVIGAYARASGPCVAEVSGGLDSSIIATSLAHCGADIRRLVNYKTGDRGGDESLYARTVAELIGKPLVFRSKTKFPNVSPTTIAEISTGLRPSVVGFDNLYDASAASECVDAGAAVLFTGQSGDGVLFNSATPLIMADRIGRRIFPATHIGTFVAFLAGLFILATGLTCLETIANPYTTVLGPPEMGATRINLAQACNAIGTILGPFIGGYLVFSSSGQTNQNNNTIYLPYMLVGIGVLVLGILFFFAEIPDLHAEEEGAARLAARPAGKPLWQRWHFVLAVPAQFFYVAAQTGIWSYFVNYITSPDVPSLSPGLAHLLPSAWSAATNGATRITDLGATRFLTFGFVLFMVGRLFGSMILRVCRAHSTLAVFAACNVGMMILILLPLGWISVAGIFLSFFFMSIMYPTIFALGIRGLGERTKQGSSLIVMSIVGGAIMPILMGWLADLFSMRIGFVMPLVCFAFILGYAAFWPALEDKDAGHPVAD